MYHLKDGGGLDSVYAAPIAKCIHFVMHLSASIDSVVIQFSL